MRLVLLKIFFVLLSLLEYLSICDGIPEVTYSDMPVEKFIFTKGNVWIQILKIPIQINIIYNFING